MPDSAAAELGFAGALFEERRDACLGIVGSEHLDEQLLLEIETAAERDVETAIDRPLRQSMREHRSLCERGGALDRPFEQRVRLDHLVDQADAKRLLRVDGATGEDHVLGARWADQSRKALGAASARADAEQDLRLTELGPTRRDAKVARQGELAPTTEGHAAHR